MDFAELNERLKQARLESYCRVRGGWPVPLAGGTYWAVLTLLGYTVSDEDWSWMAAMLSGSIFPIALLYGALFRNPFMKEKMPDQGVVFMAMAGMLMFWPAAILAMGANNDLVPLMLAIGMSTHWPVFGWSYGRPVPFLVHMIARGVLVTVIWVALPEARFTLLPLSVALIYLATVIALYVDSGEFRSRIQPA
ncbi:DUF7010 family protein [Hyphomonas sp.]|uniref:DUF7010 family protein n=1 Tax=Hyphomonas sp. TaxID=87 RepID=UPI00391B58C6